MGKRAVLLSPEVSPPYCRVNSSLNRWNFSKKHGYNTCIDTAGFGDPRYYGKILPLVDTLILDVKAFDEKSFTQLTTIDRFQTYLHFLLHLDDYHFDGQIWVRHVMVPGLTDNEGRCKNSSKS